jgi:hypothetical protein
MSHLKLVVLYKEIIMIDDPEINAIEASYTAIKDLEEDAKVRVIKWIISKFSLQASFNAAVNPANKTKEATPQFVETLPKNNSALSSFTHLSELFSQAEPKTDVERALVVAAFMQEVQQQPELTSRLINDELKHMGYAASNITATISLLISKRPNLMIQTRKEGKSQQAQKKYRVTTEGLKFVNEMLNSAGNA